VRAPDGLHPLLRLGSAPHTTVSCYLHLLVVAVVAVVNLTVFAKDWGPSLIRHHGSIDSTKGKEKDSKGRGAEERSIPKKNPDGMR
jgi:hypothetical protein